MDADAVRKTREHYNSHANVYTDRDQVHLLATSVINLASSHASNDRLALIKSAAKL